ncbi:ABC transporter ATP-binding protein [Clostridium sp. 'deep sea']|uniref:ABC transporter ATP-binding protein n=1 Tax=Clostridium sp. 'deep sea' TaxID=2779445 RepID=UPI0018964385|nr:ABC transporter ATP-binding protein [Clostridium sp. 'deep sea']QOR34552.1 ABC transporter ATP-binding protein [Clostridium sp. 'deep sea']
MSRKKILEVKNIDITFNTYSGVVKAVRDVSFNLFEGETLAIVGESGSGKSVTAKTIMGLLAKNANIENGKIIYEDKNILLHSEDQMVKLRGSKIGMIFQDPMSSLDPIMKIGKQITEAIILRKECSKEEARIKAIELMKSVGIDQVEKRFEQFPFQFSGGMRQRIVIAIALAGDPNVLICDEPTTALDVTIQAQILDLIKDIQQKRNLSVIFITHDLGVVASIADRVCVMYAGKIIEKGLTKEVFYNPKSPYTWALLSSMPDVNMSSNVDLYTIKGTPPNMLYPPIGDAFASRNEYALEIDYKKEPPMFKVSDTHYASTWLLHDYAPKVEMPKILQDRITRKLEPIKQHYKNTIDNKQSNEVVLSVTDLKQYFSAGRGKKKITVKAVDGISFDIKKGETFGLVGESGCGKTTTGRTIIRLYKPTSGTVEFKQEIISSKLNKVTRKLVTSGIQMIFQDPIASLNPRMTVKEIIAEGLKINKLCDSKQEIDKKVYEALELVGLTSEHATRYPHEFSGGQRQRIGIARAIISKPKLIIADEPISALDVSIQAQVLNLLNELKRKLGLTILFIAHDLSVVKYFCDTIAVMHKGKIVEKAKSNELYSNPIHPYTKSLLSAIPVPDPDYEKKRKRITYKHLENENMASELREITTNHYVHCTKDEYKNYLSIIS